MLVQSLVDYTEIYLQDQLTDTAFEVKSVGYAIEIAGDGRLLGVVERSEEIEVKGKKVSRPASLLIPRSPVNRNNGVHPLIGCDAIQYVMGVCEGHWTTPEKVANHQERHDGFVRLLREAADETDDPALRACVAFYADSTAVEDARRLLADRGAAESSTACLSVRLTSSAGDDGEGPVVCRSKVRRWWRERYERLFATRHEEAGEGLCLATGKRGPLAMTHDKIKGASGVGGQRSGVSLMSFDKAAFTSYGWKKNVNSPVSPSAATAYVLALNDLLRQGEHRQGESRDRVLRTRTDNAGIAFLYWTRRPTDDDWLSFVTAPDPNAVHRMMRSPESGMERGEDLDNDFYLLAVSGTGGRLVVREWFHARLSVLRRNLADWFQEIRIINVFDQSGERQLPGIWQILATLRPAQRKEEGKDSGRYLQVYRRALRGIPLGASLLAPALSRLRVVRGSDRLNPLRAGLVRLCVNDMTRASGKGAALMNEELDLSNRHPAYICGRLMAVYDSLQRTAQRELNVTVADRYYALASTNPQLAFPKLEQLSRAHLRKLRRDNPRAAYRIDKEIHLLTEFLGERYPGQQSLEDQGRFVIGFHHQKAEEFRRIEEALERKSAAGEVAN